MDPMHIHVTSRVNLIAQMLILNTHVTLGPQVDYTTNVIISRLFILLVWS